MLKYNQSEVAKTISEKMSRAGGRPAGGKAAGQTSCPGLLEGPSIHSATLPGGSQQCPGLTPMSLTFTTPATSASLGARAGGGAEPLTVADRNDKAHTCLTQDEKTRLNLVRFS